VRVLLLILACVLSGCATTAAVVPPGGDAEAQPMSRANAAPTRSTMGGRTQTVGLPLSRAGKIGLWTGVAVFLGYLMATDGDEDGAGPADPAGP
jgi:hypothetical protein